MKSARLLAVAAALAAATLQACAAPRPTFGMLFHEGRTVRTIVPPSSTPNQGRDVLYTFSNGVPGQLGVAAVAPEDRDYHGGQWAVLRVTFTGTPRLLTSAAQVRAAAQAGEVTMVRMPALDFKCPIQP